MRKNELFIDVLFRFEGFTLDLALELSKILHFNFTFKLVDDGSVSDYSAPIVVLVQCT